MMKSWKLNPVGMSANLYLFITGLCCIAQGLVAVSTLGFILPDWDMRWFIYNWERIRTAK